MSYYPANVSYKPLLFIHIPKAAGSSVRAWYKKRYGKFYKSMHGSVNHPVLKEINKTMHSFTIVRNPYDLVFSWYRYKYSMLEETRHRDPEELAAWHKGFDYWLQNYAEKINLTKDKQGTYNKISPSYNQLSYISTNGKVKVNTILRFESLDKDWGLINAICGSEIQLPYQNKTKVQGDYKTAYTVTSKKIVEQYYKDDLEFFNYNF